jgi:glycerol-3-phosphate dehydrogenase
VYSDCRVDDARLTVINADVGTGEGCDDPDTREVRAGPAHRRALEAEVSDAAGDKRILRTRALVNAGGPWVMDVLDRVEGDAIKGRVRLVKGSHIIVPKVHSQGHAWILQNPDKRVIFVIPYEGRFSLIGTTDVPVDNVESARAISDEEIDYLIAAANRFLAKPISKADIVSSYAGVRPLYDDGSANPSEVTRDYVLRLDHTPERKAPLVTVFGGKITIYRHLAEEVMSRLAPFLPGMKGAWTATETLPGGNVAHFNAFRDEMHARHPQLGRDLVEGIVRRHGNRAPAVMGEAQRLSDLGRYFGGGLTEREVRYLQENEWASAADDFLWRRTKCGLHMNESERAAFKSWLVTPA